jgi:hypothetical protein
MFQTKQSFVCLCPWNMIYNANYVEVPFYVSLFNAQNYKFNQKM